MAIQALGMDQNNQGLKNMIDMITGQGGHSAEFGEFLNMMNSQISPIRRTSAPDGHVRDPRPGSGGKISFNNLKKVATELAKTCRTSSFRIC